ncbi:MAG TPA: shikimate kinase [Candidatus Thermoplasmatota archaeon]|nr:shikimate kinase [Candidatus Thermoplasmatota archaeon]
MTVARARANGAVSVVNAIVTGFAGSSVAVDLHTEAKVTLLEDVPEVEVVIDGEEAGEEGMLARLVLKAVVARLGEPDWGGRVETKSDIPSSRGLKSSSAAANAVALAANHAFHLYEGRALSRGDCLAAAIEAALDAGVTITGAFDDASASLDGGLVVTDNRQRLVLHREAVDDALRAVLLVPATKTPTASVRDLPYAVYAPLALHAHALARKGDWFRAMTLNGLYTAALYGSPATWSRDALAAGALAAGLSGTGPAFAAIARADEAPAVEKALRDVAPAGARLLTVPLTNRRAEAFP